MNALLSPTDLRNLHDCKAIFFDAFFTSLVETIDLKAQLFELAKDIVEAQRQMYESPQDILRACGFPSTAAVLAGYDDRDPEVIDVNTSRQSGISLRNRHKPLA